MQLEKICKCVEFPLWHSTFPVTNTVHYTADIKTWGLWITCFFGYLSSSLMFFCLSQSTMQITDVCLAFMYHYPPGKVGFQDLPSFLSMSVKSLKSGTQISCRLLFSLSLITVRKAMYGLGKDHIFRVSNLQQTELA